MRTLNKSKKSPRKNRGAGWKRWGAVPGLVLLLAGTLLAIKGATPGDLLSRAFYSYAYFKKQTNFNDYKTIRSWLGSDGLRGKYAVARQEISLAFLNSVSPHPVFRSGPHGKSELNLDSIQSFGHYNPRFLDWLGNGLSKFYQRTGEQGLVLLKNIYKREFQTTALTWYGVWKLLNSHREKKIRPIGRSFADLRKEYASSLSLPAEQQFNIRYNQMGGLASRYEKEYDLSFYEVYTAGHFWLRRSLDGTAQKFAALLDDFLTRFDPRGREKYIRLFAGGATTE